MKYYFLKTLFNTTFDDAIEKVTKELNDEGFGVLTEIDYQANLKEKLNINFGKYKILGACNPSFTYKALQADIEIGTILPCNIVVKEKDDGKIGVSATDPLASMFVVGNTELNTIAKQMQKKLKNVINKL